MMRHIYKIKKVIPSLITGLCLMLCPLTGCKEKAPPAEPDVVKKSVEQAAQTPIVEKGQAKSATEDNRQSRVEKEGGPTADQVVEQAAAGDVKAAAEPPHAAETGSEVSEKAMAETGGALTVPDESQEERSLKDSLMGDAVPKYDSTGKIDPFAALYSKKNTTSVSDDTKPIRPLTPLEKIDLSQLTLVAVLRASSGNSAMVEDATGKGYVLTPGTYIGRNSGVVAKILKDRVVIEEKIRDLLGKESTGTKELKLQKPFGEE